MKITTKHYVKQQVRNYLNKHHSEMSCSRIERIAAQHSAHPLTIGFNDDVDIDACVCKWYHSLNLNDAPCEVFEQTIVKTLRETKRAA